MPEQSFGGLFVHSIPPLSFVDASLPIFGGIVSASSQNDGSFVISWNAGSTSKPRLRYEDLS